jgi:hypothetical protein
MTTQLLLPAAASDRSIFILSLIECFLTNTNKGRQVDCSLTFYLIKLDSLVDVEKI